MIPTIGLMVGVYIFARAWEIAFTKRDGDGQRVVMILLSIAVMLVSAFCTFDLLVAGLSGAGNSIPKL